MSFSSRLNNAFWSTLYESVIGIVNSLGKLASVGIGFPIYYLFRNSAELIASNIPPQFIEKLLETYVNINRQLFHELNITLPAEVLNPDAAISSLIKERFTELSIIDTLLPDISATTVLQATAIDMGIAVGASILVCLGIDILVKNSNHPYRIFNKQPEFDPATGEIISTDEWRSARRRTLPIKSIPIGMAIAGYWLDCNFSEILMLTFIGSTGLAVSSLIVEPMVIAGHEAYDYSQKNARRALTAPPPPSIAPSIIPTGVELSRLQPLDRTGTPRSMMIYGPAPFAAPGTHPPVRQPYGFVRTGFQSTGGAAASMIPEDVIPVSPYGPGRV